jgi:cadaverine:lysine antiporter
LSTFFPILNNPIPAGIACIAIVWIFTFVNMLGGTWVSRLTTIGLVLVLIPVVMTAVIGWHWFDAATYQANWNTSSTPDSHAVIKSILLCLWAFVGVESAAVSTGMVKNPKRTVPLATMLGTAMAGRLYRRDSGYRRYVSCGSDGCLRCAVRYQRLNHSWRLGCAGSLCLHRICLPDFSGFLDDAGWSGRGRAANDGNFPKVYGEVDNNGIPKKACCWRR